MSYLDAGPVTPGDEEQTVKPASPKAGSTVDGPLAKVVFINIKVSPAANDNGVGSTEGSF